MVKRKHGSKRFTIGLEMAYDSGPELLQQLRENPYLPDVLEILEPNEFLR